MIKNRWIKNEPIARLAHFGINGPEENSVYGFELTGLDSLTAAVSRRGHLDRVVVPISHLIFLVDMNPRKAGGVKPDAKVFFDNGMSMNLDMKSIRYFPFGKSLLSSMVYQGDNRVRALLCTNAIQEFVPLVDDDNEISLLSISNAFDGELWPELGHKR